MSNIFAQIAEWLAQAQHAVAFTGAGISTESGIPDFRSPGGVWSRFQPVLYDEFMASAAARQEYWRQKSLAHVEFAAAVPNAGHQVLARWQSRARLAGMITQNIDGLHQLAGSDPVWELHGTAREIVCQDCNWRTAAGPLVEEFVATETVPLCQACGSDRTKHATISFGQALDQRVLEGAMTLATDSDLFFAIGSSLVVQPAASLPQLAASAGGRLVIINREATPLDDLAAAVVRQPIGEALTAIDAALADVL
ncbi:MAG: NAD-dependent deacetylase [Planctomycetota bacterium]|nr:MAG: NAD-dependent deacetylase [Planctomycetota bacterium]REK21884.1 MAG: NAD-dependent deacetylase [Planctomycetota bacterium]REK46692.1 MAG: NAD-dependent deacetylase [Planctomycetota bacterium]